MRAWPLLVLLVACSASRGRDDDVSAVDAASAVDAPRLRTGAALSHTLFVATDGANLAPGADDATLDHTQLVPTPTALRPWLAGVATRATTIGELIGELEAILAPYDVDVVTARPATGPYDMLVITDDPSTAVGLGNGIGATTPTSCNATPSVIALMFYPSYSRLSPPQQRHAMASAAIGMLGIEAGVPISQVAQDCMCFAAGVCNGLLAAPCRIGGAGTMVDPNTPCGDAAPTMDEAARFLAAFGPR